MHVTNIRVSYLRERQPAQYEKQTPFLEVAAVLEEGEDHVSVARKLMLDVATVAYNAMGFDVPAKIPEKLLRGELPEGGTVEAVKETAAEEAPSAPVEPAAEETEAEEDEKPKRRGRPKGSKNTRPKKGTQAAKEAEEAQKAAATAEVEKAPASGNADADDIPDDDDPKMPQISTNPEDRRDPDADDIPDDDDRVPASPATTNSEADDVPDVDEAGVEGAPSTESVGLTGDDLNAMIGAALKANKLSLPDAKSITRHFQVARVTDLSPENVLKARDMLEKMMEAKQ